MKLKKNYMIYSSRSERRKRERQREREMYKGEEKGEWNACNFRRQREKK